MYKNIRGFNKSRVARILSQSWPWLDDMAKPRLVSSTDSSDSASINLKKFDDSNWHVLYNFLTLSQNHSSNQRNWFLWPSTFENMTQNDDLFLAMAMTLHLFISFLRSMINHFMTPTVKVKSSLQWKVYSRSLLPKSRVHHHFTAALTPVENIVFCPFFNFEIMK